MSQTDPTPPPALDDEPRRPYRAPVIVHRMPWQDVAEQLGSIDKKTLKLHTSRMSLSELLQFWAVVACKYPGRAHHAEQQIDAIEKRLANAENTVPGAGWLNDLKGNPQDRGGEFPPGGSATDWNKPDARSGKKMVRAQGERRVYPSQYLTTSGHSFDVYTQVLYGRKSQHLTEDGYRGAISTIYDFHPAERKRFRGKKNGKHGASNTIDRPWDGIPD